MKYYSGERDSYVLKYKKVDDYLIVSYADGREEIFPYTIEKEKELLQKEKEQIVSAYREGEVNKKERRKFIRKASIFASLTIFYGVLLASAFSVGPLVALGVFAGFAGKNIKKVLEHSKHLKEFEKYKMFIKNEDIINENVENGFDEALGIDLEAQNRRVEGIRTINPNNIDDYSYRDIKNILNDTECPRYDYGDTGTIENKVSKGIEKIKAKVKRR